MTNDSGDRIRAIQGHSLERFHIDELYEKINNLEEYVHHSRWEGGDAPDRSVLELTNENHLDQWRRIGTFVPSIVRRFHTMRAVCGTVKQEFGAKNIVLYAFLSVTSLFEHSPKIDMYITNHGRIVTKCGIPWSTVTKVRTNGDMGTDINMNPMQAPPPSAPAGSQRVRSRDSKGGSPAPPGFNFTDFPLPDRKIITKNSNIELRSGHHHMLSKMTTGSSWEQHRQLQMLRGVYKTTRCDYEFRGCQKGSKCCFAYHRQ